MAVLFLWNQILGVAAAAILGTAAAQPPGSETVQPMNSSWAACCGYDYNYAGVCLFAEMVAGYSLPTLDDRFFLKNRRLTRLQDASSAKKSISVWETYEFRGDGVTGTLLRRGTFAFFEQFQVDGAKVPVSLRNKTDLLSLLGKNDSNTNEAEVGCEKWAVRLHFSGERLDWAAFRDFTRSYD